jgi:hypothetical protein
MTITYRVDGNLVLIEAAGELSNQEVLDFQTKFIADHRIHAGFRALFDASTVRSTNIDDTTIDLLLEMERSDPDKFRGSRTAVVFIEPCGWTRAKEFERRASRNIITFLSREVAKTWLGI